jgi:hypothetical protein
MHHNQLRITRYQVQISTAMASTTSKEAVFELPKESTVNETNINATVIPISTSLYSPANGTNVTEPQMATNETNITHINPGLVYPSMLTASTTLRKTCLCRCDSSIYTLDNDCHCDATCSCVEGCSLSSTGICTCTCGDIAETLGTEQWMLPAPGFLSDDAQDEPLVESDGASVKQRLDELYT